MKKLSLLISLLAVCFMQAIAQNDTVIYITDLPGDYDLCLDRCNRVIVYGLDDCNPFTWTIQNIDGGYQSSHENPLVLETDEVSAFYIFYTGECGFYHSFFIDFTETQIPVSFTRTLWKRQNETLLVKPVSDSIEWYGLDSIAYFDFVWSTGQTAAIIEITEPGTYTCEISDMCSSATRTFIVRDNVELYRATVDLASGLNKVTWLTTPEQAEYVSQVKIERDGMTVGTAPYEDGQFIDNIGSENAARTYRLTAIGTDGTECPLPSYQKGTLHVDYSPNAANPNKLNMAWTPPFIEDGAPLAVSYFQICKYDPATGEVTVIDQIGANNTIGSYDVSLFDGGHATVAALFSEGRAYDDMSFSNLTEDILAIGEKQENKLKIYPNPAMGAFTVEGAGNLLITNALGQEILAKEIDGKTTVELPQGLYFLRLNGVTRKIVVE